ncbi:MAG TPA: HlyD family efflux transporter periplasmic adaptor subunit [Verrucomicrobiae bacterium]|jgi:multidrug resistance efflux pump
MNRDSLPPIPTPPALRWREFRVRFLPIVLFVASVGGISVIWEHNVSAPVFVGAVEGRSAQVASPCIGKILQLRVDHFQMVTKGTPLAVLSPTDPRTALAAIQSELDILRAKIDPYLTRQRNATDYEQLQVDWLEQRVDLATARVNLQGARDELYREKALHEQKLVADDIYEQAVTLEGALTAEVFERSNLVQTAEAGLKQLDATGSSPTNDFTGTFAVSLQIEEQKLKAAVAEGTGPVTLVAPMDGVVGLIYHQAGENISEGSVILTIAGTEPERIVAYLRQPVPFDPKVGQQVEVRTRTFQREMSRAHINSVGAQFEPITNVLAMARPGGLLDFGLPVEITLPPGLKIRPGELVDLSMVSPAGF